MKLLFMIEETTGNSGLEKSDILTEEITGEMLYYLLQKKREELNQVSPFFKKRDYLVKV